MAKAMVIVFVTLLPNVLATKSEFIRCGPDNRCSCASAVSDSSLMTMDCSGSQFQSLCEICNSSAMYNVTALDASNNNIYDIESGPCVSGCSELESLDLHNNIIAKIEETVFETIHRLIYLDLSCNNLEVYSGTNYDIFIDNKHLKTLFLNGNVVKKYGTALSYPDLSNLTSLVNLSMDGLPDTPFDSSFSKLTNLTGLFMSGQSGTCNLGLLHNDTFKHLPHIEVLKLTHCNISNIELLTFSVLHKLRWLDLSYNQRLGLETLHNVSYGLQFTDVKFLNYSYVYNTFGRGTILRKHHVCYLWNTTLQELSLSNNRIEMAETNALMLIPKTLQTAHFNFNYYKFQAYFFQACCLNNITNLFANHMNREHRPFANLLYFKETQYPPNDDVYKDKNDCPFMDIEFLKNRSIENKDCPYLIEGKTARNARACLPKSLRKISITDSKLNYKIKRPISFNFSSFVEFVNLSGNALQPWASTYYFDKARVVDLSRNYCQKLSDDFFKNAPFIENIQAGQNLIGLYPENLNTAFQNLTTLKVLNLSDNRIAKVPPMALRGLTGLETLDLRVNLLKEWEIEVQTLDNLTHLVLRNNLLEGLPEYLTSHLVMISKRLNIPFSLDLRGNNLKCTCKYQTFLKWIIGHGDNLVGFGEMQFYDENGATVASSEVESELKKLGTKCRSNTVWIVLSTIGVSLSLSLIAGGLVYRNRWKLRYFMYMSKQRFYGYVRVPNEDPIENYKYDAFISYAEENLRFVKDQIIPRIEQNGVSLCVHQRDFLPGNTVGDNIVEAIKSSRKTVVLLTKAFLKRKWCMYEFNMARMETIYSRDDRGCLVVVMLEEVPAKDMPLEMLRFIQTESYIEYTTEPEGQVMFWDQLNDAISTR